MGSRDAKTISSDAAWRVILALWVCFIWGHSLVSGPDSSIESLRFVALFEPAFRMLGVTDASTMNFVVRKVGHFSEHLVLGLLCVRVFRSRLDCALISGGHAAWRAFWPILAICIVVPLVDESIQIFTPGRCSSFFDSLLDMCGAAAGIAVGTILLRHFKKRLRS
ncbi:MAG: VanZ family protein [Tractidigestivibacter sp.]|jgi:VanZ family protein|uniref:VanZ family protein n=1 Tax=Tractidigestivibacter sp. TaxID=2847320 RepID=UPI003D8FBD2B